MRRNLIIFLITIMSAGNSLAQQYPFVHYTPKDGLVSNRARFMFQDSRGLLYILTRSGFSIYDGQRFTNYTMDDGLASPIVNDIVEMGEDSFMIIPNASKVHWLVRGQLKPVNLQGGFCPVINKMIQNANGDYYALADEGLYRFDLDRFTRIDVIDQHGRDAGKNFISGITKNNKLFLITDPEVHAYPAPAHLIIYDIKTRQALVDSNIITWNIVRSPDGEVLMATLDGIRKLDEHALEIGKIKYLPLASPYRTIEKLHPGSMYFDREKNLWLSIADRVWRLAPDGEQVMFYAGNGLNVNHMESVFEDRESTHWFIDGHSGISKLTNSHFEYFQEIVPGFRINEMFADSQSDTAWFLDAANGKLVGHDGKNVKEINIGQGASGKNFRHIAIAGNKKWLTDQFDSYLADPSWRIRKRIPTIPQDIGSKGINAIIPDGHGNLLVLSEEISVVLQEGKKIVSHPLGYFSDHMELLPNGILWVATRTNHVLRFRIHPGDPDHYFELLNDFDKELPRMGPMAITGDRNGNLWIGTGLRGLFFLHFLGDRITGWKQLTVKDGLTDNFINFLHTDSAGNIWACTSGGLDKIRLKDDTFFIENVTHNQNIYQFAGKVQTNSHGEHWATIGEGAILIKDDQPKTEFSSQVIFREIAFGSNLWDNHLSPASLPYTENNLNVTVAAPSFVDEKQVRFSYKLDGSNNKDWSRATSQSSFDFVNLAPGKYTLRARAEFINGRYPASETSFHFTIHPPWWQTWWFRMLIFICILVALALVVRSYYRGKLMRQKQKAERQQAIEKERTRIARDMHDDLGSGLSTIRFLTEKIRRNVFSDVSRHDIIKMQETSNDLIDKMNEIIWAMNEKNDSLEDLIIYTRSYVVQYCDENGLECRAELPEYIPMQLVSGEIRRNVFLTVKECLHNIVKHAKARKVQMMMDVSKTLDITVTDDGIGFNGTGSAGNGLRNMHSRMESIGGKIIIQNGQGVSIKMEVPLE